MRKITKFLKINFSLIISLVSYNIGMRDRKLELRLLYVRQNLWEKLNELNSHSIVSFKAYARLKARFDFVEQVLRKLKLEIDQKQKIQGT